MAFLPPLSCSQHGTVALLLETWFSSPVTSRALPGALCFAAFEPPHILPGWRSAGIHAQELPMREEVSPSMEMPKPPPITAWSILTCPPQHPLRP